MSGLSVAVAGATGMPVRSRAKALDSGTGRSSGASSGWFMGLGGAASQRRCTNFAMVQALLTLIGIGLSLLPFIDDDSERCPDGGLCLADLHRHSMWLTPPSAFWGGVAAICILFGCSNNNKMLLTAAYDLLVLVAPVSLLVFLILTWKAIAHAPAISGCRGAAAAHHHHHKLHHDGELDWPVDGSVVRCASMPMRAMVAYAGTGFVMQLQAAACVGAALALRAAKLQSEAVDEEQGDILPARDLVTEGDRYSTSGKKLPRGWRRFLNEEGRTYYESYKTGERQWHPPERSGRSSCASDTSESDAGRQLPRRQRMTTSVSEINLADERMDRRHCAMTPPPLHTH